MLNFRKQTASFILMVFAFQQFLPAAQAQSLFIPTEAKPLAPFEINISAENGTIENLVSGSGPALVHIQTAHGNYDAQIKIEALLNELKKKYGFDHVFVEGSAFRLQPEILSFTKDEKLNREIAEDLTRKSLLKGTDLFLINHPDVPAAGIEDLSAYRANVDAFRAVLVQKEKTGKFLNEMNKQIDRLSGPYLNKDLRAYLKRLEEFESETITIADWLPYIKAQAQKVLNVDLSTGAYQLDWPTLVRIFKLQDFENRIDAGALDKERKSFLKAVKGKLKKEKYREMERLLNEPLSRNSLPSPETEKRFENLVTALPSDFNYRVYPNLNMFIGHLILQSEVKGDALSREIEDLTEKITQRLAVSAEEKTLLELFKSERLLTKLFALQLSPSDYEKMNPDFKPSVLAARFSEINQTGRVKDASFQHLDEIDQLFVRAQEFYSLVKKRDRLMCENVLKQITDQKIQKAVVVTGGFHAGPFKNYFESNGFSYALIAPSIKNTDGYQAYVDAFLNYDKATLEFPEAALPYDVRQGLGFSNQNNLAAVTRIAETLLKRGEVSELTALTSIPFAKDSNGRSHVTVNMLPGNRARIKIIAGGGDDEDKDRLSRIVSLNTRLEPARSELRARKKAAPKIESTETAKGQNREYWVNVLTGPNFSYYDAHGSATWPASEIVHLARRQIHSEKALLDEIQFFGKLLKDGNINADAALEVIRTLASLIYSTKDSSTISEAARNALFSIFKTASAEIIDRYARHDTMTYQGNVSASGVFSDILKDHRKNAIESVRRKTFDDFVGLAKGEDVQPAVLRFVMDTLSGLLHVGNGIHFDTTPEIVEAARTALYEIIIAHYQNEQLARTVIKPFLESSSAMRNYIAGRAIENPNSPSRALALTFFDLFRSELRAGLKRVPVSNIAVNGVRIVKSKGMSAMHQYAVAEIDPKPIRTAFGFNLTDNAKGKLVFLESEQGKQPLFLSIVDGSNEYVVWADPRLYNATVLQNLLPNHIGTLSLVREDYIASDLEGHYGPISVPLPSFVNMKAFGYLMTITGEIVPGQKISIEIEPVRSELREIPAGPVVVTGKLGGTSIAIQLITPDGLVGQRISFPTLLKKDKTDTEQEIVGRIVGAISSLIDQAGVNNIVEVFFTAPGFFGPDGSLLEDEANIPGLKKGFYFENTIAAALNAKYPRPAALGPIKVRVSHDGAGAALGELSVKGTLPGKNSVLFIIDGTGVGTGTIIDGNRFTGGPEVSYVHNEAPHHLVWDEANRDYRYVGLETAGRHPDFKSFFVRDTLSSYRPTKPSNFAIFLYWATGFLINPLYRAQDLEDRTSGPNIAKYGQDVIRNILKDSKRDSRYTAAEELRKSAGAVDKMNTEILGKAANAGNALAREIIEARAYELGIGIAVFIYESEKNWPDFRTPQDIIIGSGVAQIGQIFLDAVRAGAMARFGKYGINFDVNRIQLSKIQDDTARELYGGLPTEEQIRAHQLKLDSLSPSLPGEIPEADWTKLNNWARELNWDGNVLLNVRAWYASAAVNDDQRAALLRIIAEDSSDKIKGGFDSAAGILQPGTAGTRGEMENLAEGKIGPNYFSETTVIQYTWTFVNWYKNTHQTGPVFITKEVRENSDKYGDLSARILSASGIRVIRVKDPVSTPFASYLAKWLGQGNLTEIKPAFGYQISASHNQLSDNGIKFMGPDGEQLMPDFMASITSAIPSLAKVQAVPEIDLPESSLYHVLTDQEFTRALNSYFDAIDETMEPGFKDLITQVFVNGGKKFVFTALNGASGNETILYLKRFGLEVGTHYFIVPQDMLAPDQLPAEILAVKKKQSADPANDAVLANARALADKNGIDIVMARDPDGDRFVLAQKVNGQWMKLDGNQNGTVFAHDRLSHAEGLEAGSLMVIRSHATTGLLDKIAAKFHARLIVVPVGFKYFGALIIKNFPNGVKRSFFGVEESYGSSNGQINEKDGLSGLVNALLILARQHAEHNRTIFDYRDSIYLEFGFPGDAIISIPLPESSKPEQDAARTRVRAALKDLKAGDPFGSFEIISSTDIVDVPELGQFHDGYDLVLKDNKTGKQFRLLFRASGTEPLFKAYFSWLEPAKVESLKELAQVKEATGGYLTQTVKPGVEAAFTAMAASRSELRALEDFIDPARLTQDQKNAYDLLTHLGQEHLFTNWSPAGQDEEAKISFFDDIIHYNKTNPHGDLTKYVSAGRTLLQNAKTGEDPLKQAKGEPATGKAFLSVDEEYQRLERIGLEAANTLGFVLVAGGVGDRLKQDWSKGLPKIEIPVSLLQNLTHLEKDIRSIHGFVSKANAIHGEKRVGQLFIMTSDETDEGTVALLSRLGFQKIIKNYSGVEREVYVNPNFNVEVRLGKQEAVPAFQNNSGQFVNEEGNPYKLITKPHGHGDVHSLLYSTGTAADWEDLGIQHAVFFQDTNAPVVNAILPGLGLTITEGYDINYLTTDREIGEPMGMLMKVTYPNGRVVTRNVEYSYAKQGVVKETARPDGKSIYPGNMNVFIVNLRRYNTMLKQTTGVMAELINPKYKDASKETFPPARPETNMQDLTESSAASGFSVGVTSFADKRFWFAPTKNDDEKGESDILAGRNPDTMDYTEAAWYRLHRMILALAGVKIQVEPSDPGPLGLYTDNDPSHPNAFKDNLPAVEWDGLFAATTSEVGDRFRNVEISNGASLSILGADVHFENVKLAGGLIIKVPDGSSLTIRDVRITNEGHQFVKLSSAELADPTVDESLRSRHYKVVNTDQSVLIDLTRSEPGAYVFDADGLHRSELRQTAARPFNFKLFLDQLNTNGIVVVVGITEGVVPTLYAAEINNAVTGNDQSRVPDFLARVSEALKLTVPLQKYDETATGEDEPLSSPVITDIANKTLGADLTAAFFGTRHPAFHLITASGNGIPDAAYALVGTGSHLTLILPLNKERARAEEAKFVGEVSRRFSLPAAKVDQAFDIIPADAGTDGAFTYEGPMIRAARAEHNAQVGIVSDLEKFLEEAIRYIGAGKSRVFTAGIPRDPALLLVPAALLKQTSDQYVLNLANRLQEMGFTVNDVVAKLEAFIREVRQVATAA